ncbi:hypothetical protein [Streptomyces sp. NPDC001492]
MTSTAPVPAWPRYRLTADQTGAVTVTGPAARTDPHPGREQAVAAVAAIAARLTPPRAVLADAVDVDGTVWPLLISPDGTVQEAGPSRRAKQKRKPRADRNQAGQASPAAKLRRTRGKPTVAQPAPPPVVLPQQASAPVPAPEPFVIPLASEPAGRDEATTRLARKALTTDEPTTRLARGTAAADERTVHMRATRPAGQVADRHDRPTEEAPPLRPAVPPPPTAPAQPDPRTAGRIPSVMRIHALESAGQLDEALQMAAALDDAAARAHGPSHRDALEAREVRAHLTAQRGDLPAAVALYRDVAERRALQNDMEGANAAAGRAHALWLKITDPVQALKTGETIVRMRNSIPGEGGIAYRKATQRLQRLRQAATGPASP